MLLSTKLRIPQLSSFIVPRPRLFDLLAEAPSSCRVTLVTAPAGYGKTTLVAGWLAHQPDQGAQVTWLLLDEYDDEPMRFLRYLIAALQQIVPDVGTTLQAMLLSNQIAPLPQRMEEMLTTLINELAQSETPVCLVLDDLHHLTDPQIVNGLRFWIEHAPDTVQTILTSRDASMLPIARWKVRRHCHEITMSDLCFTAEEAALFIRNTLRLALDDKAIAQLTTRTEGWIAGLQLAAMSLQSAEDPALLLHNFTGSDRHVTDYLVEEVLEKQPAKLRNFLLQTSILKRLSAPLCDALLQSNESYQLLAQLEKRNLFLVPLDNQRQWYRYHPLFAEALQTNLTHVQQSDVAELHRRAYRWLADNEESDAAIEHALAAHLYPEATALIFAQCQEIVWQQGRPRIFLRWCDQIPEETLFTIPRLMLAIGWALLLLGKRERLTVLTKSMRARWSPNDFDFVDGPEIRNEVALLEAEIAVQQGNIRQVMEILAGLDGNGATLSPMTQATAYQLYGYAHRLDGNIAKAKEFLHRAVRITEQNDETSLWLFSHFDLAETHVMAGELTIALSIYEKIRRRYPEEHYTNYLSLAYIYHRFAHALYLQNRLSSATDYAQRGLAIGRQTKWLKRYARMILAEIQYVQGKWPAVTELITEIRQAHGQKESANTTLFFEASIAKLFLLHGDTAAAAGWAATYRQHITSIPRYQLHVADVTFARYQLAVEPQAAISLLNELGQRATEEHWHESLIEIQILLALAQQVVAQPQQALAALDAAFALAEPEQIMTPFLVEGPAMAALLRQALVQSKDRRGFIGQLQAAFLPIDDDGSDESTAIAQPLVDPLSQRELDVLQLIAAGRTNPEIAEELIIATGTVAKHTNNIFSKLTVRNRTEAVQRAQSLGLI